LHKFSTDPDHNKRLKAHASSFGFEKVGFLVFSTSLFAITDLLDCILTDIVPLCFVFYASIMVRGSQLCTVALVEVQGFPFSFVLQTQPVDK